MSNKLKKVFSNDLPDISGKIRFKTKEDLAAFVKAMQSTSESSEPVKVSGIKEISTSYDGYPLFDLEEVDSVLISSSERVAYDIETKIGQKRLLFTKSNENGKTVLQTEKSDVFYVRMEFIEETGRVTFTYKFEPEHASSMKKIVDDCDVLEAFLDTMFYETATERDEQVEQFKNSIGVIKRYFKMICDIERELDITFSPDKFGQLEKEEGLVEELYFLLVKKEAIRLNVKLREVESAKIEFNESEAFAKAEIGAKLESTFLVQDEYQICEQRFVVYKPCLMSNTIIREIKREDGKMIVYYDDTDSKPMYISYTGFTSEEEAKKELKSIMEHSEEYTKANTLGEHYQKLREQF